MKNLIPILTYILELPKEILIQTRLYKIELYASFLNQNLIERYEIYNTKAHPINRFIPCDLEGNILKQPIPEDYSGKTKHWVQDFRSAEEEFKLSKNVYIKHNYSYLLGDNITFLTTQGGSRIANYTTDGWIITDDFKHLRIENLIEYDLILSDSA